MKCTTCRLLVLIAIAATLLVTVSRWAPAMSLENAPKPGEGASARSLPGLKPLPQLDQRQIKGAPTPADPSAKTELQDATARNATALPAAPKCFCA